MDTNFPEEYAAYIFRVEVNSVHKVTMNWFIVPHIVHLEYFETVTFLKLDLFPSSDKTNECLPLGWIS
jgi:hypothetical protein